MLQDFMKIIWTSRVVHQKMHSNCVFDSSEYRKGQCRGKIVNFRRIIFAVTRRYVPYITVNDNGHSMVVHREAQRRARVSIIQNT